MSPIVTLEALSALIVAKLSTVPKLTAPVACVAVRVFVTVPVPTSPLTVTPEKSIEVAVANVVPFATMLVTELSTPNERAAAVAS